MSDNKKLGAICLSNLIWSMGSFVNVVFLFFIPAKFGIGEIGTGVIMSLVSVAIFIGTLLYPRLINKQAPINIYRLAVIIGSICFMMSSLFYDQFWIVVPFTLVTYIMFSLTRGLNKKIISIAISDRNRRKAYNYTFAVANLGGVFAGILSPFIFNINVDNMQYIFLVNAVSMIIAYLLLSYGVRSVTNQVQAAGPSGKPIKVKVDPRLLLATSGIYYAFFQISFLIPKIIENHYSLHMYSLAIVVNTLMCVVASPLSVKIFTRNNIGEVTSIKIGTILMILSFIIYNITALPALIIATILFAVGEVLVITNLDSYLLTVYSNVEYDNVLTKVRMLAQLNRAIGPLVGSICIVYLSYADAFGVAIVYALISLAAFCSFNKRKKLLNNN